MKKRIIGATLITVVCALLISNLVGVLLFRSREMDAARNQQPNSDGERLISADGSRVRCAVIPTNEERMIALDAIRLGRIHTAAALA